MTKSTIKVERLNNLIRKNLLYIIKKYIFSYNAVISITFIKTTYDLSASNIYILISNNELSVVNDLNKIAFKIKNDLSKKIRLYKIPTLYFFYDIHTSKSINLFNTIDKLN